MSALETQTTEFEVIRTRPQRQGERPEGPTVYRGDDGQFRDGDGEILPSNVEPSSKRDAPAPSDRPERRLRFLSFGDLDDMPDPTWIVEGWLPERGVTEVFGRPKSFKSFLALDWALHIASGKPWHGKDVRQGPVFYLSLEGGTGIKNRMEAWSRVHGERPDDFHFQTVTLNLRDVGTVDQLVAAVREHVADGARLVVIDTLSRALAGGDENSPSDMGQFVRAVDAIAQQLDTSVAVVHHSGHENTKRSRGHSSWLAAVDVSISVKRHGAGDTVTVKQEYARDAAEGEPVKLARRIVEPSMVLDWQGESGAPSEDVTDDERAQQAAAQVLAALAKADEPLSQNALVNAITVKPFGSEAKRAVIDQLVEEGKVSRQTQGRAHMHTIGRP